MKNRIKPLIAASCITLLLIAGCSDKSSPEACRYQTTMNLDTGNYDAVLSSSCADGMQRGAAWFGKAGYDIKDVLNRFIDANKNNGGNTQSDLNIYMTALIGNVKSSTLIYLDNAKTNYSSVPASSEFYKDALFYTSLVDIMKSLSLIKIVIPNLETNGQLNMSCDKNANGVPDEADATACALIAAQNISTGATFTCSKASYTRSSPINITLYEDQLLQTRITGTYSGLTINILNTGGTPTTCQTAQYKRLLYQSPSNSTQYWGATTTSDFCFGSDGNQWYCPVTGSNQDLVTALDSSIYGAISTLSSSITTTTNTDLQASVNQIHSDACKTPCPTPCTAPVCPASCLSGATTYCSSQDVSNYITTYLK